jgi:hypothetical protein
MSGAIVLFLKLSVWSGVLSDGQCLPSQVESTRDVEMRFEGALNAGEFRSSFLEHEVDLFRSLRTDVRRLKPDPVTSLPEFLNLSLRLREGGALSSNCQLSARLQPGPVTPFACSVVSGRACWGATIQGSIGALAPESTLKLQ